MLELRNITKIYHSKSGNDVVALNNVSVSFPDTGMVFILGKSGCGKSTLLNVIGGLDGCDNGEFIIKGKSSRDFAGSDFDAYRNTFIGFIFQEYNILDEFSVGANIALALELQGKKATNEQINAILEQVGMLEYANRKPNELSGGQKQRIAIARALVKDPEIIMADEPTGALDSNTGKQIFDTLKQLSKTKLVIIVSHDRDFAEVYGDRIIEMKDGIIISDVTKHQVDAKPVSSGILMMNDNLLKIEKGYQLTAKDLELINAYLRDREGDVLLSSDARVNESVRSAAGISSDNKSAVFKDTDVQNDVKLKTYDGKKTSFIRSRLPMKNAVKMGSSSLGHKKFRLVFTIFLSLIAFTLFGFADTLGSYDKVTAATNSIVDTNIKNASFSLGVKQEYWIRDELQGTHYNDDSFNDDDLLKLNSLFGITFTPVFNGSTNPEASIDFSENMQSTDKISSVTAYTGEFAGFADIDKIDLNQLGFIYDGTLPQNNDEIAISKLVYEQFKISGFKNENYSESITPDKFNKDTDGNANSIIGKHITVKLGNQWYGFANSYTFKITAVIDTQFEYDRYASFIPNEEQNNNGMPGDQSAADGLIDMFMGAELQNTLHYGYHNLGYVTKNSIDNMSRSMDKGYSENRYIGEQLYEWRGEIRLGSLSEPSFSRGVYRVGSSDDISNLSVIWFDNGKTQLKENEMLVCSDVINYALERHDYNIYPKIEKYLESPYIDSKIPNEYREMLKQVAVAEYLQAELANKDGDIYKAVKEKAGVDENDADLVLFVLNTDWVPSIYTELTNGDEWRQIFKTKEELLGSKFRKIAENELGIDFDEYQTVASNDILLYKIFNSYFDGIYVDGSDTEYKISSNWIKQIYAELIAYNTIYADDSIYKDTNFINTVINNFGDLNYYENADDATKKEIAANCYKNYLCYEHYGISWGDINWSNVLSLANKTYVEDIANVSYSDILSGYRFVKVQYNDKDGGESLTEYNNIKIVGYFEKNDYNQELVISDTIHSMWIQYRYDNEIWYSTNEYHNPGIYAFAIAPMGTDKDVIRKFVTESYDDTLGIRFELQNQVMNTLDSFNDFIETGASIFIYIGLGFALFASLMMMNFISTSISYKRREIGILRAVGARSSDVFKIFFSEAFIIALINYVLSVAGTIAAVIILNNVVRSKGINVTLLNFGIRQVILMFLISVAVAVIASFLPVWKIAKRKPVDAIKNT